MAADYDQRSCLPSGAVRTWPRFKRTKELLQASEGEKNTGIPSFNFFSIAIAESVIGRCKPRIFLGMPKHLYRFIRPRINPRLSQKFGLELLRQLAWILEKNIIANLYGHVLDIFSVQILLYFTSPFHGSYIKIIYLYFTFPGFVLIFILALPSRFINVCIHCVFLCTFHGLGIFQVTT